MDLVEHESEVVDTALCQFGSDIRTIVLQNDVFIRTEECLMESSWI